MFLSIIIPTIGREKLERAVESVLTQDVNADYQLIVVNDSGRALPPQAWQTDDRVQVLITQQVERSASRNLGSRQATGEYLLFLDDDDFMLPGAFSRFYATAQAEPAGFIYGRSRLIDRNQNFLVELQYETLDLVTPDHEPLLQFTDVMSGNCLSQIMAGEFVPIMASIYRRDVFEQTGGFYESISCAEDIDMARHMALYADLVAIPHSVVCAELGSEGSSTDKNDGTAQSHLARERILDKTETLPRLIDSAGKGPYWFGRVVRTYLSSAIWNARRGRFQKLPDRILKALIAAGRADRGLLRAEFWQAIRIHYLNGPYIKGFLAATWH
jgi:glycosyltransferase involved in cell wall biosynthesis